MMLAIPKSFRKLALSPRKATPMAPRAAITTALHTAYATDISSPAPIAAAGIAAVAGLFAYEDAFVRAGQSVPLS